MKEDQRFQFWEKCSLLNETDINNRQLDAKVISMQLQQSIRTDSDFDRIDAEGICQEKSIKKL